VLLEHLWPQLTKIVAMDWRMSETALHADLVLPATQHHEKVTFNMPTPWTMFLTMSDAVVPPAGEARSEWEVLADLCTKLAERASARGLETYRDRSGTVRRYDELWSQFTLGGTLVDDETVAADMVADAVDVGNLPAGTSLATFRERGLTRYADWGFLALAKAQASPFPKNETHSPLRNHVELGHPYPTLTRRAQFLIDHPWYREGGEDVPAHKEPPSMGGDYPFRLSGGHSRWSVHAMNMTNPVMLETHRGKPFVLVNEDDARRKHIRDDGLVRVWNDCGEFVVSARTSPAQRPGALTVYNGFEGFMFPGGRGHNEVEPGLVKWLHLVAGYGHLTYTPTEWQPTPSDRCVNVDCEPHEEEPR
jgi:nitrate reductase alpha subunit